jgi:hypothetical protein
LLLLKLQRKLFESKKLFLSWVLFLVCLVLWISIVTIVEPWRKQRILGHRKGPNMFYDVFISYAKSLVEVM